MSVQLTGKSQLDGDEGVMSAVGHGLQVAGDAAVGLRVLGLSEAAGDFLFDLAHAQIALGAVIGHVSVGGKEQHGGLMLLQSKQWDGRPHPRNGIDVPEWELLGNHLNRVLPASVLDAVMCGID